ncbi:hypothetical protein ACWD00_07190 [Streptomyces viridiviolaceus]
MSQRDCELLGALDIGVDEAGVPLADFVAGAPPRTCRWAPWPAKARAPRPEIP